MPKAIICEHGLPTFSCGPCAYLRRMLNPTYRERRLLAARKYKEKTGCNALSVAKRRARMLVDEAYRESCNEYARNRRRLDPGAKGRRTDNRTGAERYAKQRARRLIVSKLENATKAATKYGIPYSVFYRCKICKRSTPNVNKHCDAHQEVYEAMQQAIELYQLTKQLRKGIHHVRYQD